MKSRQARGTLLVACTMLLAGCASSQADTGAKAAPPIRAGASMTPGMVMPDGSTMGATTGARTSASSAPSAAARMICSTEIRKDIGTVLALKSVPSATSNWSGHVYTCTYQLPMGTFVLSVKESADPRSAKAYADALRTRLGRTHSLAGLTNLAFATSTGTVALVKDNDTLQVDATRLPAEFGGQQQKRTDFAYEIASDILGCWTGD